MAPVSRIYPLSGSDLERGVVNHLPAYQAALGVEPGDAFEATREQLAELARIRAGRRAPIHMDALGQRLAAQVAEGLLTDEEARDKIAAAELELRRLSEAQSALQSRLLNNALSALLQAFTVEAEVAFPALGSRFGEHLATFEAALPIVADIEDDRAAVLAEEEITAAWASASRSVTAMKKPWELASGLRRDGLLAVHPKDAGQRAFWPIGYSYRHPDRLPDRPRRRLGEPAPQEHPVWRMASHLPAEPALLSADDLVALEAEGRRGAQFEDDEERRLKRLDRDRRRAEPPSGKATFR